MKISNDKIDEKHEYKKCLDTFVTSRHSGSSRWLPQNNFGVDQRNIRRGLGHSTWKSLSSHHYYHHHHHLHYHHHHHHHLILLDGSPRSVSGNWFRVRIWVSYLRPLTCHKFWSNRQVRLILHFILEEKVKVYIYDNSFAEVMVVRDGMEVMLAGVLRVLVNPLLLVTADFWQRSKEIAVSDKLLMHIVILHKHIGHRDRISFRYTMWSN